LRGWIVQSLLVITVALPAFAFVLAGTAKLQDPFLGARFMSRAFWVRLDTGFLVVRVVALGELLVGSALCLWNGRSRLPAYAGLCLLAFFVGLLVNVAMSDPHAASCGCFGSLMGETLRRSLWTQAWIDLGLALFLTGNVILTGTLLRNRQ
jgi:hypothetical protein